jgi:hypothetical protein
MKKILLLNDTTDHDNWGSVANAEWLKAIIQDTMPGVTINSVLSHWTTDRFYQLPWWLGSGIENRKRKIISHFSKPFSFLPVVADDFERVADEWCAGKGGPFALEYISKLDQSDAVVFNAEGSTYKNNVSAVRCLFAIWLTVTRFKKPAFFTNGSVTLTYVLPVLNAMVQRAFRDITGVSVREPCSLENVQRWVPDVKVAMYPDSVFYSAIRDKTINSSDAFLSRLENKKYFCFSLSMLNSRITGYKEAGIEKTALYDLIKSLQKLVPNAVLMAKDRMDQSIIKDLAQSTGSLFFGPEHHYTTLVPLFQNAQFMISGRYHHLIMAAISGCPAIPLRTTSHKIDGLCRLLYPLIGEPFDPTWLRPELGKITDIARDAMAAGDDLRCRLRDKSVECGKMAAGVGEMIRKGIVN